VYGLPVERVWVSVYEEDEEALALWRDVVGVHPSRIRKMGAADNFWASGPTGRRRSEWNGWMVRGCLGSSLCVAAVAGASSRLQLAKSFWVSGPTGRRGRVGLLGEYSWRGQGL
jgi:hypothetical protein